MPKTAKVTRNGFNTINKVTGGRSAAALPLDVWKAFGFPEPLKE